MKVPFLIGRALFGGKKLSENAGAKGVPKPDAAVIATGGG